MTSCSAIGRMACILAATVLLLVSGVAILCAQGQVPDHDDDGINDILEYKLAKTFAPEWRFHKSVPISTYESNRNEKCFPSDVEWVWTQNMLRRDEWPEIEYYDVGYGAFRTVPGPSSPDLLSGFPDPREPSRTLADLNIDPRSGVIRLDYSTEMAGDPEHFPTYYHVVWEEASSIMQVSYYLWFPEDESYEAFGSHRGDWESVLVDVVGIQSGDLGKAHVPEAATLRAVIFFGHHFKGKRVEADEGHLQLVSGTHPRVFVAAGMHAMYPEPGMFHFDNVVLLFDHEDWFYGNGVVTQSWSDRRRLVALGEYSEADAARAGRSWLRYRGWWGPDGTGSSPPGPVWRGRWEFVPRSNQVSWLDLRQDDDFHPAVSWDAADKWDVDGEHAAYLFHTTRWRGCDDEGNILSCADGERAPMRIGSTPVNVLSSRVVGSVLLCGGSRLQLAEQPFFRGALFDVVVSSENLNLHPGDPPELYGAARLVSQPSDVCVGGEGAGKYQIGTEDSPYASVGSGTFAVRSGGVVRIRDGVYTETLTLRKPLRLVADGGKVRIGLWKIP